MSRFFLTACVLLISLFAPTAQALELEVRGKAADGMDADHPEASLTVLRTTDQPAGGTLADLLGQAPGAEAHSSGGSGTFSSISIRGASAQQNSVDLEGIPLAGSTESLVNFADFDGLLFDRITLSRNGAGDGLAGNISLGLLRPKRRLRLVTQCGSYATCQSALAARLLTGTTSLTVAGAGFATRGNYAFEQDNGTPLNPDDDSIAVADNNAARRLNLLVSGRTLYRKGQLRYLLFAGYHQYGLMGRDFDQSARANMRSRRLLASLQWQHTAGSATFSLLGHAVLAGLHFDDRFGELGLGNPDLQTDLWEEGLNAKLRWRLAKHYRLELGSSLRAERSQTTNGQTKTRTPVAQRITSNNRLALFARPLPGWLSLRTALNPNVAFAEQNPGRSPASGSVRTSEVFWDPSAGIVLAGRWPVSVQLAWSRSLRRPSFSELFGNNGPLFPNPDLLAERAQSWETALWFHPKRWDFRADLRYFQRLIRNQIVWVQNSPNTSKAINLERVFTDGVESQWRGSMTLAGSWKITHSGSLSWLRSTDRGSEVAYAGKIRPQTPTMSLWQRSSLQWRKTSWFTECFWQTRLRGSQWRDRANREKIAALESQDAGIRLRFAAAQSWETELTVRNLLDRTNYDYDRYPLPGRGIYFRLGVSL